MNDEKLYLEATNEVENNNQDPALWSKVMALTEGDKDKAKYKYIKLRVDQLVKKEVDKNPTFTKKIADEFLLKYMPISEFSEIKSIPEKKIIEMIREGFYVGQIKNNEWFVSRDEVGEEDIIKKNTTSSLQSKKSTKQEYIPVDEFAKYKGINTEKIIAMIRDGFYQGQIIDNEWYVSHSEIEDSNKVQNIEEKHMSLSCISKKLMPHIWWRLIGITIASVAAYFVLESQALTLEQGGIKFGAVLIDAIKYVISFGLLNSIYSSFQFGKVGELLSSKKQFMLIGGIYGLLTGVILGVCYGLIKSMLPHLFSWGVAILAYFVFAYPNPILVSYLKSKKKTNGS